MEIPNRPAWLWASQKVWFDAFEEIHEHIESDLRETRSTLESYSKIGKLERTDVNSLALWMCRAQIEQLIASTILSRTPVRTLAAFAYATKFVPVEAGEFQQDADDATGKYIQRIKKRLDRAEESASMMAFCSIVFQMLINEIQNHS